MKGTVVNIWLNTITKLYGEATKNNILTQEGWNPNKLITPLEEIEDKRIMALISAFARKEGISSDDLWRKIGQNNIESFYEWFPSYFDVSNAMGFLMMMDRVHAQLTKMIPGAKPPRLIPEVTGEKTMTITYKSKRGLFQYLYGLFEGVAKHYNEKLDIKILEQSQESDGTYIAKFDLGFEKSPKTIRKYGLSKFLSFGFIKNIPVKITVIPTLLSALLILALNGIDNIPLLIATPVAVALSSILVGNTVIKPIRDLSDELDKIRRIDIPEDIVVKTGDHLERAYDDIAKAKDGIREEFTYFKGGMDDLYSFTDKFSVVAKNLGSVSDLISQSVQEVAEGAIHQATETEGSVSILADNIEILNQISQRELDGKESLESAVQQIEISFNDLERVSLNLNQVKDNFSEVNTQGNELSKKVKDIITIVSTVESIAEQTNLLALNASIEAARAGEMGRGFSVVAEEIRKLAEDSKDAVSTINSSLNQFTHGVNSMVKQVNDQFIELENGTQTMASVTVESKNASSRIKVVSESISEISKQLSDETQKINKVFENMHTLAAIAEENSATSQEMSANVTTFSAEITSLTENISELEKVVLFLKNELKKYHL